MPLVQTLVSNFGDFVRLLELLQMYALQLVLVGIFFAGLYKFAVSILK
jgi:hypothetical protein